MKHYDRITLFEHAAGELDTAFAQEVSAHLQGCSACAELSQQALSLRAMFATASISETSRANSFVDSVVQRASARQRYQSPSLLGRWKQLEIRQWVLPAFEVAFALAVFAFQSSSGDAVDMDMVLLASIPLDSVEEDFSPAVADLSEALGISLGDS